MFDVSHLPNVQSGADVQVFKTPGNWFTWVKPRGKSKIFIWALGSGSGGGGGRSGAAASARGGGGAGATGSIVKGEFPAQLIPDLLFCYVPQGGVGGGPDQAGGAGQAAEVWNTPPQAGITQTYRRLIVTASTVPTGGSAGLATAGGAGGAIAVQNTAVINNVGAQLSNATFNVATAGVAGGAHTGAVGASVSGAVLLSSGAGGGGVTTTDFAGGGMQGSAYSQAGYIILQAGGAADGGNGLDGYEITSGGIHMPIPVLSFGGTGGGSNNDGLGGAGGRGGLGSGGGGGGGGVTGGRGGDGGHGLVVIISE
jgi:hypothetical protein